MANEIDRVLDSRLGRLEIKLGRTIRVPDPTAPDGVEAALAFFGKNKLFGLNEICQDSGRGIYIFALVKK